MDITVIAAAVVGIATIVAAIINAVGNVKAAKYKVRETPETKQTAASEQIRTRRSFTWPFWLQFVGSIALAIFGILRVEEAGHINRLSLSEAILFSGIAFYVLTWEVIKWLLRGV